MTTTQGPTRRSFIRVAGAALSAPVAAAVAHAPVGAVEDDDPKARLARLEDLEAIRALNRAYARHVDSGAHHELAALFADPADRTVDPDIRRVVTGGFGEPDVIEIAADRETASARLPCTVHAERAIAPSCPLVEMAREQGGGVVRRTEQGVFEHLYVRHGGIWKIRRSTYRPT